MTLNIALIGAGFIGRVHAGCAAANPRTRLLTVHDVDVEAARALASDFGAETAPALADAINHPDTGVVIIAASSDAHGDIARACIRAGTPFLCEKPLDISAASALETAALADAAGLFAGMAFNRRFDAQHAAVKRAVEAGDIGTIETLHVVSRTQSPPTMDYVKASGGQLRDKGSHFFDLACWIAAERPVEIYAKGACLIDPGFAEHGDVDTAMIVLTMQSGALCQMNFSRRTAYGYDERIEVMGSAGMLQSGAQRPLDVALYQGEHVRLRGLHPSWYQRIRETYPAQLDALVDALAGDGPFPGLMDGLVAETIAAAGVRSLRDGVPVPIRYDFE